MVMIDRRASSIRGFGFLSRALSGWFGMGWASSYSESHTCMGGSEYAVANAEVHAKNAAFRWYPSITNELNVGVRKGCFTHCGTTARLFPLTRVRASPYRILVNMFIRLLRRKHRLCSVS